MKFIMIHLALSSVIALIGRNKINIQERFSNFCLSFFFPVGGYIAVLVLYLLRNKETKEMDDPLKIKNTVMLFNDRANFERDVNIVPLEEALIVNDVKVKRQQLIDTLKKDFSKYTYMLSTALKDQDIETSHYAASAITEIKRELDLRVQEISVEYEKDKSSIKLGKKYVEALKEYLDSNLLDQTGRKIMTGTYIRVLESIVQSCENDTDYDIQLINALFETGELDMAGNYCASLLEKHESEDAYILNLKYSYLTKDKARFYSILRRLQSSPVKLTDKGIDIVRFWLEGA